MSNADSLVLGSNRFILALMAGCAFCSMVPKNLSSSSWEIVAAPFACGQRAIVVLLYADHIFQHVKAFLPHFTYSWSGNITEVQHAC